MTINVHKYAARHDAPVFAEEFDRCTGIGEAQPTSRLLAGTQDQWAAEEWSEPVILSGGAYATRYYLFGAAEIIDDDGAPLEADQYPWDETHVSWIELQPTK